MLFGVLGFFMRRYDLPIPPLVMGIILGPMAEQYFLTSMVSHGNDLDGLPDAADQRGRPARLGRARGLAAGAGRVGAGESLRPALTLDSDRGDRL